MLAKAMENAERFGLNNVRFVEAEWTCLSQAFLGEKFDAIICLGNAFTHLFEEEQRVKALKEVFNLLKDDGIAIIDQRNYDMILDKGFRSKHQHYYLGETVNISAPDISDEAVKIRYEYGDGSVYWLTFSPIRQEYLTSLLGQAGFRQVERYGDFQAKYDIYEPDFIVQVAKKRGALSSFPQPNFVNKRGVMELRLIISREDVEAPGLQRREIGPGVLLYFDPDSADLTFQLANDRQVYLWGDVFYLLDGDGTPLTRDLKANLQRSFETQTLEKALQNIEGTFIGILVDPRTSRVELFSDSFARIDCFYAETGRGLVVSTTLDPIFERVAPQYDQLMLAHFFSMYGWNPPKSHTIYSNVQRLSVGEILSFSAGGLSKRTIEWRPESYLDYGPQDLEKYYQALRTSVISRADQSGVNWVWFSGGWDTSAILAILIDEFGTDKVQQIIGRVNFSSKTGPAIMNVFRAGEGREDLCLLRHQTQFRGFRPHQSPTLPNT